MSGNLIQQQSTFSLFRNFNILYPTNTEINLNFILPSFLGSRFSGTQNITIPSWLIKSIFLTGSIWVLSAISKSFYKIFASFFAYLRSRGNQKRMLRSKANGDVQYNKKYVVIYGAANQIGTAFAKYFALKGLSLVLIDDQDHKLQALEGELSFILSNGGGSGAGRKELQFGDNPQAALSPPQNGGSLYTGSTHIKPAVMIKRIAVQFQKGSQADKKIETKMKSFIDNQDLIKFFVDCKNLKIKDGADFHLYDLNIVSKIASFNTRGCAMIYRIVLKNMLHFKIGGIISVINNNEDENNLQVKHSLYYSTCKFREAMNKSLEKGNSDILKFITVHNDPNKMKQEDHRDKLVQQSMKYLGIHSEIQV